MKEKQSKILNEVLRLVPFDGWSKQTLCQAVINSGLGVEYAEIAFKNGVVDAIEFFHNQIDAEIYAKISNDDLRRMKIRDRIFAIIDARFTIMDEYKPIIRKNVQFFAMPQNLAHGSKLLWEIADKAWYVAGDESADFNYYTKRATLVAVYSSSLLFWLEDESEFHSKTSAFLRRRIENVMQFGSVKKKISELFEKAV